MKIVPFPILLVTWIDAFQRRNGPLDHCQPQPQARNVACIAPTEE